MTHQPPSAAGQEVTIDRRAFVACAVGAVGVMGVVLVATPAESTFASSESLIIPVAQLTTATAILLVTTSAIFYQRWRAGTEGGSLALSITVGLMAFGSLDLVGSADGWDRVGVRGVFDSMAAASRIAAIAVLALALTVWRHEEPRLRTVGAISVVGFLGALVLVDVTSFDGRTPGGVDLEGLAYFSGSALAWLMLVLGALSLRQGRVHHRVEHLWMGVLAVVVGMSSIVLHHVSASTHLDFLGGVGLLTVGTALVTAGLHNDLVRIEAAQNSQFRRVALEAETGRMVLAAERNDRAIVAHDGRSALLAIEGGLRYVAANHHGDPEATEDIYRALTQEVARLRRMLSGRAIGERKRFLVADAIAPAIRLHALEYDDIVVDATTDAHAFGDPDATREIIQNLLDNAIQHGAGRNITLRAVEYLDSVTITIADHGPGVPESLHEAIFERGVSSKPDEASGLGLHSSRDLATKMSGELRIDPVAKGASFTLTLPSAGAAANASLGHGAGGQVIDLREARAR